MSVPSLASNRVNVLSLDIGELQTQLNDLSNYVETISGNVPIEELEDVSQRVFNLESAVNVLDVSSDSYNDDIGLLFGLINALDVSNISGFIVLYDLSQEVWSLSGRFEQTELQIDASFGSLTTQLNDLSQFTTDLSLYVETINISQGVSVAQFNSLSGFTYDLSAYVDQINLSAGVSQSQFNDLSSFTYILYNSQNIINNGLIQAENDIQSVSGNLFTTNQNLTATNIVLGDLSSYVYNYDPQNAVSIQQFEDLSGFVKTNAFLTSRTITNGSYVGSFNQSGSTASFQGITSLTGNIPTLQGITATFSNVVATTALQGTSIVPPGPSPGSSNIEITTTGDLICNTNITEIVGNLQLDEEIIFCPQGSFTLVGADMITAGMEVDIPSSQADVNTILNIPNVMIMNCAGVPADSATSTQMGTYLIKGGYRDSRNWMWLIPYGFSQTPIANMRIALDKAYFATNQHPIRVPSYYNKSYYGLLLSSKSKYINQPTITESHIYAEITEKEKDKNVYGVYSAYDFPINNPDEEDDQVYSLFIPQKTPQTKIGYSSSGGEGQVWVCNLNGNIQAGDYLHSSKIPGIAVRQEDDVKHNYTIFKSAFDCDFKDQISEYPKHILDASNDREWRNPEDHKEGFKYEMVSYTNKVHFLRIAKDFYEIVGVLKYPYDFQTHSPELINKTYKVMLIGGVYCN